MSRTMKLTVTVALALALAACGGKGEEKKADEKKAAEGKVEKPAAPEAAPAELKPVEQPPAEVKPVEAAPAEQPPAEVKPVEVAPVEQPPAEVKPVEAAPAEQPPAEVKPEAATDTKPSIEDRRKRVQEIYRLGRSEAPEDLEKLRTLIMDEALPGYERATAIRALGNKPRAELMESLKTLADIKDLAISSEASILLFQWGEKEFATPRLKELQKMGIALRRAFFLGLKDGNYEYAPEAEEFFAAALEAPQAHVRLDAALGLLHLGKTEKALEQFQNALKPEEKSYVRLTAVSYLASARKVPEVQALLETAAQDSDPKVSSRAKQILGAGQALEGAAAPAAGSAPAPAAEGAAPAPAPAPAASDTPPAANP
ncbi:MAG: hypothetical protein FJ098_10335 [Deltaproteobacteria bacterium]|nr:hypothetical protein [Deltaproteobacteria bacterium]